MSLLLLYRPRAGTAVEETTTKGFYLAWNSVREWERRPKPKKLIQEKVEEVAAERESALDALRRVTQIKERIDAARAENAALLASLLAKLADIQAENEKKALEKQAQRLAMYLDKIKADHAQWLLQMDEIDTALFLILASEV